MSNKTYLDYPFEYKNEVKKMSACWDEVTKKWYVKDDNPNYNYLVNTYNKKNIKNGKIDFEKAKKSFDDEQIILKQEYFDVFENYEKEGYIYSKYKTNDHIRFLLNMCDKCPELKNIKRDFYLKYKQIVQK